jgi:hypothetical protein
MPSAFNGFVSLSIPFSIKLTSLTVVKPQQCKTKRTPPRASAAQSSSLSPALPKKYLLVIAPIVLRTPAQLTRSYTFPPVPTSPSPLPVLNNHQCAKFSRSQLFITEGENLQKRYTVTKTVSGSEKHKCFCSRCGCTLWTIPMNHGGEKVIVRTSLVDGGYVNALSISRC